MSRLTLVTQDKAQLTVESMYKDLERRITASPLGLCPVDLTSSFIKMCLAQSCGKCVPCRVGLAQLAKLFDDLLDGKGTMDTIALIKRTAEGIYASADCAIGYEAAEMVLKCVNGCMDDMVAHVNGDCTCNSEKAVPCVHMCPANVDIPGYIALVKEGRYADAVRVIRKDNPLPVVCALICEHPCEHRCKRTMIDAPVNIRGLKRMAVDNAGDVPAPVCSPATGKKVAIVGGGPGGLTAAYYLSLMGHKCTIFEQRKKLGGMLRYGIPNYRLPRTRLQADIDVILSTGVEVKREVSVGKDVQIADLARDYDAVYVAIGAHTDKKLGIEGEEGTNGVISAVTMLRSIGDDEIPDYSGKRVVVVGGGNVAMDCARSSVRLGAESVSIVYRRRKADMTALKEEVEGAEAEGCNVVELKAPVRIEKDANNNVKGLWVQPQMISNIRGGRPAPKNADAPEEFIECDMVIVAIGQNIVTDHFEEFGMKTNRGTLEALNTAEVDRFDGVFAGGDCVTGPATVIKAIAGGKVAAANIDHYLGFHHEISCDVEIPAAGYENKTPCGRVEIGERYADDRRKDLDPIELPMSCEEACQEAGRCLRCDRYGFGALRGGRVERW